MTHEQQFEQRLADWLEDGPLDAPDRAIDAAVAHAHAHPRRRSLVGGLGRTLMSRMQPAPFPTSSHRSWVTAFATIATVAVVALVVVGGGALLLNRSPANQPAVAPGSTVPSAAPTASPAARSDDALVADLAAVAASPYDAAKVAALYAPDAVLYDKVANETSRGLKAIQAKVQAMAAGGFKVVVTSAAIRQDDFLANFATFGNTSELSGRGLVVYELKDGKVKNQWVYDAVSSPAASSPAAVTDEALVADLAAVMSNPYDAATVAALYAPNAVIHETTADQTQTGLSAIGRRIRYFNGENFKVAVTSAPIRQDNFVAHFARYGTRGDDSGRALVVYELKDGKVLTQWIYPAP